MLISHDDTRLFRGAAETEGGVDDNLHVGDVDYSIAIQIVGGGRDSEGFVNDALHVGYVGNSVLIDIAGAEGSYGQDGRGCDAERCADGGGAGG